jgi:hypothetical protein
MPVWQPVERARERIMAYGGEGVGKTKGALDIARRMVGTGNKMWVVDIDNTWERMAPRELWADEGGPLEVMPARGWADEADALEGALSSAGRDDWVVADSSSWMWDDVLEWYVGKVFGTELPAFLIQHRKHQLEEEKKATAGQDATLVEWNYINPLWHRVVTEPLTWAPCHVYVTAEAGEMRSDGRDSKQVRGMYGSIGWKPRTQKKLGFAMQTVLFMEKSATGEYKMQTVKDREDSRGPRVVWAREPWSDFFTDYLRGVAGWKAGKKVGV